MKKRTTLTLDVWGGLGDNLQVSTIPRRFYEKYGYKGVYISNSVPWRNDDIKKIVWDLNPYIAGYTDKKGINIVENGLVRFDGSTYWLANMEKIYQFNEPFSKRPEIFYKTKEEDIFNVKKSVVIDISYSQESFTRNIERYPSMITLTKNKLNDLFLQIPSDVSLKVIFQPEKLNNINFFEKLNLNVPYEKILVENLFDYSNIIKNCKQYVCSHSGCHALAAAIRPSCVCIIPENYYNMKYFVFEGIKYIKF